MSIALCCILKNEKENIPQLLKSIPKCFDEIHFTDTGSSDGSIEVIKSYEMDNPAQTPLFLHHFDWVDDFSLARNYSFSHPKTDYLMWLDLDDVLSDPKQFIQWRDSVMNLSDFWVASYHYASDKDGNPICSFARERVVRRSKMFSWKYFVHEGMMPRASDDSMVSVQYTTKWAVIHKRTDDDQKKDVARNLHIFEKHNSTDARMVYYHGKELYENQRPLEAYPKLMEASKRPELEIHDRIMALQYSALSAMLLTQFEVAIDIAHKGLQLDPLRAEFHVIIADSYVKLNKLKEALIFYESASVCPLVNNGGVLGALFSQKEMYTTYPLHQIAKIYGNMGSWDKALVAINEAKKYGETLETSQIETEIKKLQKLTSPPEILTSTYTDDLVISCHPEGFYEWDEEIYSQRGIGGSETAVVEVSRHIAQLTGRKVCIFNNRQKEKSFGNVHYFPVRELKGSYENKIPKAHLAWRHNIKLFPPKHHIWCHDMHVPGLFEPNYEKVLALSTFHKNYLMGMFNIPEDKILVISNGINLDKFKNLTFVKNPMKIVYSSSPDRGLVRAMKVLDHVRSVYPVELHAYYGFNNQELMGKTKEVGLIKAEMEKRPWVTMHGNIEQKALMQELSTASIWLYPTWFTETFCLTSLEMLGCKVYPVVRKWGALPDTLSLAKSLGQCDIIDADCNTEDEEKLYALAVINAIEQKKWETINYPLENHTWEGVAKHFIEFLGL